MILMIFMQEVILLKVCGTFTHSSGTIIFNGISQDISADGTTFYGFNKTTAAADILLLLIVGVTTSPTIVGNLILVGASGNILDVESSSVGVQAPIRLQAGGEQTLDYLKVRDSDATGGGLGGVLLGSA